MAKHKTLIILIAILIIASFFRLWQLDKIPPGLYPDVAINGNDALNALKTNNFRVFYPENNGREGLFINLIALSFLIFGVSVWSIKIVSALIGILTVFGLYFFTKELLQTTHYKLQTKAIALLSSFFLAVSFWHTNFSRIGFRAILVPFILIFSFYFLFRGFRTQKIVNLVISGIFFGLGFYTYISFRFAVLLLPVVLIPFYYLYQEKQQKKLFLLLTSYFLLLVFIIALPIGIYFLKNPYDFSGRATPISIFTAENPLKEFAKSLVLHLGMFNFYGDGNWRHNFAGSPMLFFPVGILFLVGLIVSIKELVKSIRQKDCLLFIVYCLLLSWFFIMLLPGILTKEGLPHTLRVVGVIPVVYIFAGLGGLKSYEVFDRNSKKKKLLFAASFLVILAVGVFELNKYFVSWGRNPEVWNAFSSDYVEIGQYLNSLPPEIKKYVIVNQSGVSVPWPSGIAMPAQTIMFVESIKYGKPQSTYVKPENLAEIETENKKTVIALIRNDSDLFLKLKIKFPEGEIQQENGVWRFEIE